MEADFRYNGSWLTFFPLEECAEQIVYTQISFTPDREIFFPMAVSDSSDGIQPG